MLKSVRQEYIKSTKPCFEPRRNFVIDSYGKVVLCYNDYLSEIVIGDLNKESIMRVWKGKRMSNIRKELARGNRKIYKMCEECDL